MSKQIRENLLAERRWYQRQVNKPWEEDGFIKISVKGALSMTPGTVDYNNDEPTAVAKIYDFYGKVTPATVSNIIGEDSHFYQRPMMRPLLLYSIPKADVESAIKKSAGRDPSILTADLVALAYSRSYSLTKFDRQITEISDMFTVFQKQSKFFAGSTKPAINFIQDYNKLVLAHEKIKSFIRFNGLQYRTDEADKVRIEFAANYRIINIILVQGAIDKYLFKGSAYYLQDTPGLQNLRVNQLLSQLNEIHRLTKEPELPTWTEFINNFLPGVEINFFGRPHTPPPGAPPHEGGYSATMLGVGKPYMDEAAKLEDRKKLKDPWVQAQLLREAMKKDPKRKKMEKKMQETAEKMKAASEKVELVREFISKWGIDNLIYAALECLAIRSGMAVNSIPPIPGLNPYDIMPKPIIIKIPKMSFQMPTVDYLQALADQLKEGVIGAAYDALMAVSQTLAEIILALCQEKDEEEITESTPINDLIKLYPQPDEIEKPGHEQSCLEACYEQTGIDDLEIGNLFLSEVARRLTPRETCDLINSAMSQMVIEIVKNTLVSDTQFQPIRAVLTNDDEIIEFFANIGRCVSSEYCESVYAESPIDISDLDPCTIEDLLVDQLPPNIFDALIDALNADDLMAGAMPDLGCGAGIMPAIADIPVLNYSITNTFINMFEPPSSAFINDISLLKDILLTPTARCLDGMDPGSAALLQELEDAGLMPNPGPKRDDDGKKEKRITEKQLRPLINLFPEDLRRNGQIANIINLMEGAVADPVAAACTNIGFTYEVAPQYKENLSELDKFMGTMWSRPAASADSVADYGDMYFWLILPEPRAGIGTSPTTIGYDAIYFSPGHGDSGLGMAASYVGQANLDSFYTHIEVFTDQQPAATTFNCGNASGDFDEHSPCHARETYQLEFGKMVFGNVLAAVGDPAAYQMPGGDNTYGSRKSAARRYMAKNLYFPAYKSLFNSTAANIANSKLFEVHELQKLSLIPAPCSDGSRVGNDLFDIYTIIQEALDEFKENSCSDKTCAIGPVEDALIYAALNAYMQILLLEQLLKNIFLLDAYGLGSYLAPASDDLEAQRKKDFIVDNIMQEIYVSIGARTIASEDPLTGSTLGDIRAASLQTRKNMLRALYSASIIFVDKLRIRTVDPATGLVPEYISSLADPVLLAAGRYQPIVGTLLPHPDNPADQIAIPDNVLDWVDSSTEWAKQAYGEYAFEYMVKRRLSRLIPKINELFNKPTTEGPDTSFLLYGLPETDLLHLPKVTVGEAPPTPAGSTPAEAPIEKWLRSSEWDTTLFGGATPTVSRIPTMGLQRPNTAEEGEPIPEPTPINYNYGLNLKDYGIMRDTISPDEALYARENGVLARENYIEFKVNHDNLQALLHAPSWTPEIAAEYFGYEPPAPVDIDFDPDIEGVQEYEPCGPDGPNPWREAREGLMQRADVNLEGVPPIERNAIQQRAKRLKGWLFDGGLLPTPELADVSLAGEAGNEGGEYVYPRGWSKIKVGIDQFNTFVNSIRREDTQPDPSLDNIRVTYIIETICPLNFSAHDWTTSMDKLGMMPFDTGMGLNNENDTNSGGRVGPLYYHAIQGPLNKNNYGAIRFWLNEVVNTAATVASRDPENSGQYPMPAMRPELGDIPANAADREDIWSGPYGAKSVSPTIAIVGFERMNEFHEASSYRKAYKRKLSLPIIDRWSAPFTDVPHGGGWDTARASQGGVEARLEFHGVVTRTAASTTPYEALFGQNPYHGLYNPADPEAGFYAKWKYANMQFGGTTWYKQKKVYGGGGVRQVYLRKQLHDRHLEVDDRAGTSPYPDLHGRISITHHGNARGQPVQMDAGNSWDHDNPGRYDQGGAYDYYYGLDLAAEFAGTDEEAEYDSERRNNPKYRQYRNGLVQFRLRKSDLYESDYNQAIWTGFDINTLRGYTKNWWGNQKNVNIKPEGTANIGFWEHIREHRRGPDWKNDNDEVVKWRMGDQASVRHLKCTEPDGANLGGIVITGDASADGFGDWAAPLDHNNLPADDPGGSFFTYPNNSENDALWADMYVGPEPLTDYLGGTGDAIVERRQNFRSKFLPDLILKEKLISAYDGHLQPAAAENGPGTGTPIAASIPAPLPMEPWPPTGPPPNHQAFGGFAGLATGHFRVVAITLGGAEDPNNPGSAVKQVDGDGNIIDMEEWNIPGIENIVRENTWDQFNGLFNAPETNPPPGGFGGLAGSNLCTGSAVCAEECPPDSFIPVMLERSPEDMMRAAMDMMNSLLGPDFSSDRANWPISTGFITGDRRFDNEISKVIRQIEVGTRIVYLSPILDTSYANQLGALVSEDLDYYYAKGLQRRQYYKEKSDWIIDAGSEDTYGNSGKILHANTGITGSVHLATTLGGLEYSSYTLDSLNLGGGRESKYIDTRVFDVIRPWLKEGEPGPGNMIAKEIASDPQYQLLFKQIYDTDALLQFMFLSGLRSADMLSNKFTIMFNDTKQHLRIILRAALAGDDYTHRDPESTSSSNIAAAAALDLMGAGLLPFVDMGSSFIQKMLIETGKRLVKGLAEMLDPHVIIGKIIRDVSGQVIDQAEQIYGLAGQIAGTAAGLAEDQRYQDTSGEVFEKTIREHMRDGIKEEWGDIWKPMRPKISDASGLDLIGTFPYFLCIPPTPLGIAYILLNLHFDENEAANSEMRRLLSDPLACAGGTPRPQLRTPKIGGDIEEGAKYTCKEGEDPDGIQVVEEDVSSAPGDDPCPT